MVTVRTIALADRPRWEELWASYLAFYKTSIAHEVTEGTWRRLIRDDCNPHGFVAKDDSGRIVGFAHYLFHGSTWSLQDYCYLEDLFVDAAIRGRGVGRALIKAVYTAADAHNASQVYWLTQVDNADARRLYNAVATLTPFIKYRR